MKTYKYLFIAFTFLLFTNTFSVLANHLPPTKKFVVVLDAGHGGKDPGNRGNGYKEKDIALNIILKIGKELEKQNDIEVVYTRKTDVFVTLDKRAEIANDANADLFVSVHCNAAEATQAHGTETFVLGLHRNADNLKIAMKENSVIYLEDDYEVTYGGFDPNSPASYIGMTLMQEEYLDQSILLSDYVQKEFTNKLKRTDRGVKQAGFLVLRKTYMPSVLVETGFLTNKTEGKYLNSSAGQQKMASAILEGILSYKKSINLHSTEMSEEDQISQATVETATSTDVYNGITFKVQLAAGSTAIETKSYNFKGLNGVSRNKEGNLYKYYFGSTSDYLEIQAKQREAKAAGYKNCYIVAFKNNNKISVNEALKSKTK
ncbi:N-acetylmuramoyl-L-alanine amidase [Mesonia sp.]|uniref:N-acetylmuramoyl-L-alanine amidase family protein n=1 Tax=Mesonia sp. TaxID=1960830 RepID=UPI001753E3C4|nr:N-acetylmuramoyl-L-alanine amidase [Mesonia sp.]HIB38369.1 N-acetylmuramoyl-L-alanine amidase [Mesonia sp.]HIO27350.1 N-acetylmuramoyl-L-alanine amidase [Flavobacteriaceae bacterium]